MTKKQKIAYLMRENKHLTEENQRLKELSTEFKRKEVKQVVDDLINIYDLLKKEYQKLHHLRFIGIKTKLQYQFMFYKLKIRSFLGI